MAPYRQATVLTPKTFARFLSTAAHESLTDEHASKFLQNVHEILTDYSMSVQLHGDVPPKARRFEDFADAATEHLEDLI